MNLLWIPPFESMICVRFYEIDLNFEVNFCEFFESISYVSYRENYLIIL